MPEFKTVERARDKSWCTCQMLPSCKTDPEVGKCISIYLKLDGKTSVILQANHTVVQKKLQTSNIFWIYIYIYILVAIRTSKIFGEVCKLSCLGIPFHSPGLGGFPHHHFLKVSHLVSH